MSQISRQWRSLEDYEGKTSTGRASADPWRAPIPDRREAMKLMAAAWALGGVSGCSDAGGHLTPAVKSHPDAIQETPNFYSAAFVHEGFAVGVRIKHWMGRPIKVEGNPHHPASHGAAGAMAQAQLLDFYDPERAWGVTCKGQPSTSPALENAFKDLRESFTVTGGEGLVILTGATSSPTLSGQLNALRKKYPAARWLHWEPISRENVARGAELAYGRPAAVTFDLSIADVILAIESDLLDAAPGVLHYARDFSQRRNPTRAPVMNRLYAVESSWSLTGAAADHRFIAGPRD